MKKMFKDALMLLMNDKVEKISESQNMGVMYDVDGRNVRIFKKPGRTCMTCNCIGGTKFPTNQICKHKIAIILTEIKMIK